MKKIDIDTLQIIIHTFSVPENFGPQAQYLQYKLRLLCAKSSIYGFCILSLRQKGAG